MLMFHDNMQFMENVGNCCKAYFVPSFGSKSKIMISYLGWHASDPIVINYDSRCRTALDVY